MLLENGKYTATLGGKIVPYWAPSGSFCLALPVRVRDGEKAGTDLKHTMTLVNKDGQLNDSTDATLRTVFGWDSGDPFWLHEQDLSAVAFEIVVENEEKADNFGVLKTVSKVKWLNPEGGGMKMPQMADRREVLAKYGPLFRATAPMAKAVGAPTAAVAAPAPVASAPVNVRPLVLAPKPAALPLAGITEDMAWNAFRAAYGTDAERKWLAALAGLGITDRPTAAQCVALKAQVDAEDDIPFEQAAPAAAVPMLDDATVEKLQTVIGANGPAAGAWLVAHKWLQPGQGLHHLTAERAGHILAKTSQFLRAVNGGPK